MLHPLAAAVCMWHADSDKQEYDELVHTGLVLEIKPATSAFGDDFWIRYGDDEQKEALCKSCKVQVTPFVWQPDQS